MSSHFLPCDRDQQYLMPASLRDWLPEDHLAWFVLDAVSQMDLTAFYAAYRQDGWGRSAYEPAMLVALLLYAYCEGALSSFRARPGFWPSVMGHAALRWLYGRSAACG